MIVGLLSFLTAVTLYSSLIPISLYVSIELIKYFQVASTATPLSDISHVAIPISCLSEICGSERWRNASEAVLKRNTPQHSFTCRPRSL
jgi:hypothetical protein